MDSQGKFSYSSLFKSTCRGRVVYFPDPAIVMAAILLVMFLFFIYYYNDNYSKITPAELEELWQGLKVVGGTFAIFGIVVFGIAAFASYNDWPPLFKLIWQVVKI